MSIERSVMVFVVMFLVSGTCVAGGSVELKLQDELSSVTAKLSGENWSGVAQMTSSGYQQFYAGPTLKPFPYLKVGAGIGLERTTNKPWDLRFGTFASVNYDTWSLFVLYEDGAVTGPFVKAVGNKEVLPRLNLKLGMHHQSNIGFGPRIDITPVKNVTLWGAFLDGDTVLIGLNYSF